MFRAGMKIMDGDQRSSERKYYQLVNTNEHVVSLSYPHAVYRHCFRTVTYAALAKIKVLPCLSFALECPRLARNTSAQRSQNEHNIPPQMSLP
jgi:hypothetical protein